MTAPLADFALSQLVHISKEPDAICRGFRFDHHPSDLVINSPGRAVPQSLCLLTQRSQRPSAGLPILAFLEETNPNKQQDNDKDKDKVKDNLGDSLKELSEGLVA